MNGGRSRSIGTRYRVSRRLGAGGMAHVFLCWDLQLHRWCAVKVMGEGLTSSASLRQRFATEARALARLAHPNVVQIFDLVDDVAHPYLVTEYLEGGSAQALSRPCHPHHVARLGAEIARALAAAHRAQIVHRDVKPANILIDRDGKAKLGDFGIAQLLADRVSGEAVGTRLFMAPEQLQGQAGPQSDVYSLGATLVDLLVGRVHRQALDRVPEVLRPTIRRALLSQPVERGGADELADDLDRIAQALVAREVGPLPFVLRPAGEAPPEPVDDADPLLVGTLPDSEPQTEVNETRFDPEVRQDGELGRKVTRIEAGRDRGEALLRAARALDGIRGPLVPVVLGSGRTANGGRWVTVRRDEPGELLRTFAARLRPERRATWLVPLVDQVAAAVARAHRAGVAHGALSVDAVWVQDGAVAQLTGWGGATLLGLADPAPEVLQDDVRAIAGLYRWASAGRTLPHRLERLVARGLAGEIPDLSAFERQRVPAERARLGGAAGCALAAAGLLATLATCTWTAVWSSWPQAPPAAAPSPPVAAAAPSPPVAAIAPTPVPPDLERLLLARARRVEPAAGVQCAPTFEPWSLVDADRQERSHVERYGWARAGWVGPDRSQLVATDRWVTLELAGWEEVYGPVDGLVRVQANAQWVVVEQARGGVLVFDRADGARLELHDGPSRCVMLEGNELLLDRAAGMERWRLGRIVAWGPRGRTPPPSPPEALVGGAVWRYERGVLSVPGRLRADGVVAWGAARDTVGYATQDARLHLVSGDRPEVVLRLPEPVVAVVADDGAFVVSLVHGTLWIDACVADPAGCDPLAFAELVTAPR